MTQRTLALLALGVVAAAGLGRRRERRRTERRADDLLLTARAPDSRYSREDVADLPAPIRRYFEMALPEACPAIETVHLDQSGEVRTGGLGSAWKPFTATQYVTVDPPGFLWDATVGVAPLLSASVCDVYAGGEGAARVSLFGVPLDRTTPSPELNEAELLRYLAEAVLYPTALLPAAGVEWEAVDDRTARATLEHRGTTATLEFTVTEEGEIERVHTDGRPRYVDGEFVPTPWTGHWRSYERRHGIAVPTEGEVVWHLPEGDLHVWRGHIDGISYRRTRTSATSE